MCVTILIIQEEIMNLRGSGKYTGVVVGDIWYVINGVNIVVLYEILKKVNKNENDKNHC